MRRLSRTGQYCLWIAGALAAFSYSIEISSPHRWHGVVPWLTYREDTVGMGSTSLAVRYSLLVFVIFLGIMTLVSQSDG